MSTASASVCTARVATQQVLVELVVAPGSALVDAALLAVSEPVANAIRHAGADSTTVAVHLALDRDDLLVGVADRGLRSVAEVAELYDGGLFDPATPAERTHTDSTTPPRTDLRTMLEQNLLAERIVIASCQEIIRWLGSSGRTTGRQPSTRLRCPWVTHPPPKLSAHRRATRSGLGPRPSYPSPAGPFDAETPRHQAGGMRCRRTHRGS
ncbi:ATP-binding protein [Streptomyces sp. NPDC001816]|uniref:ATP-binding protein n=1 Tax=Streptomyces sp. NPDC001816 TaxID=3364612 RepID=UPI003685939D